MCSLKHHSQKIDYVLQKGDIIKLGRIKFAVKEIAIFDIEMEIDEGNAPIKHANVEAVDDKDFFEFAQVESFFNNRSTNDKEEQPSCRFCWSTET